MSDVVIVSFAVVDLRVERRYLGYRLRIPIQLCTTYCTVSTLYALFPLPCDLPSLLIQLLLILSCDLL